MASQFIQEKNLISMILSLKASLKIPFHKNNPLSNILLKINYFGRRELLSRKKVLLI